MVFPFCPAGSSGRLHSDALVTSACRTSGCYHYQEIHLEFGCIRTVQLNSVVKFQCHPSVFVPLLFHKDYEINIKEALSSKCTQLK